MFMVNADFYGDTKRDPCKHSNDSLNCWIQLVNQYKYLLAFENSLCDDYITEKFWQFYHANILFKANIIPVVRGARRSQYEKAVQNTQSFIHADDFKSAKDLAEYLLHVGSDFNEYKNIFIGKSSC